MKNIAIIDDNKITRELVSFSLHKHMEINVFPYESYLKFKSEHKKRIDLLILDFHLDLDQLIAPEIMEEIQSNYPGLPIIMLSGQDQIKNAKSMLSKGVVDYIDKNDFNYIELLENSVEQIQIISSHQEGLQSLSNEIRDHSLQLSLLSTMIVMMALISVWILI